MWCIGLYNLRIKDEVHPHMRRRTCQASADLAEQSLCNSWVEATILDTCALEDNGFAPSL